MSFREESHKNKGAQHYCLAPYLILVANQGFEPRTNGL